MFQRVGPDGQRRQHAHAGVADVIVEVIHVFLDQLDAFPRAFSGVAAFVVVRGDP